MNVPCGGRERHSHGVKQSFSNNNSCKQEWESESIHGHNRDKTCGNNNVAQSESLYTQFLVPSRGTFGDQNSRQHKQTEKWTNEQLNSKTRHWTTRLNWCKAHQEETKPTIKRTHVVIPLTDADTFQLCDKCRPLVYGGDRTSPSSSVDMKVMT